jgi:hypothetical protein
MRRFVLGVFVFLCACGPGDPGTVVRFDTAADLTQPAHFFDFPYPSDTRLTQAGTPDLRGFPNPHGTDLVSGLAAEAGEHPGWPVVPVAWFQFSRAMPALDATQPIAADASSAILLVDVDAASPERGRLRPVVAVVPPADDYVPANLLAVAPRPGFVLAGGRRYAFVVLRALGDAAGRKLGVAPELATLASGGTPAGASGAALRELYAPLWDTLRTLGIAPTEVAAAAVFTTGDVVADSAALSTAVLGQYRVTLDNLIVNFANGAGAQNRYCELTGTITYPQFQTGAPPFNTAGRFQFAPGAAVPTKQRDELAPFVITLPYGTMPAGGFPLLVYFHGSGGLSTEVVDRGPIATPGGPNAPGEGPAFVVAPLGLATAASALPVNPDRLPTAGDFAYLNFNNLPAFRDTFRQGVIEQRLFIEALRTLTIDPSVVAAQCPQLALPNGETAFHFESSKLLAMGQSMGGMYTNMVSAIEPRIRAAVPTGAGGYWSYFILVTSRIPNVAGAVAAIFGTDQLTFLHPVMQLLETAWEASDPFVYMPRVGRRPLSGHPARPIYEVVGKDDSYFPTVLYDAVALAYEHPEAGTVVWPTMQDALALAGLDGIIAYPVTQNRTSAAGGAYTGVVVQYPGDGITDAHNIAFQLDAVKYQYGCFLSTFLARSGVATVPAPAALGTPCP